MLSSLKGIIRRKNNRDKDKRYKSGEETLESRITKNLTEASNWFRSKEKGGRERLEEKMEKRSQIDIDKFKEENKAWKSWRVSKRSYKRNIKKNLAGQILKLKESGDKEEKIEGVIFIQRTEHSIMAKNIRSRLSELEKVGVMKIKIVERAGDKLVDLLH